MSRSRAARTMLHRVRGKMPPDSGWEAVVLVVIGGL